jgi:cytochrome c oxidase cbb3-type subunit 4
MMTLDHETLVAFSKSYGLFYLLAMSAIALAYALWPANQAQFDRAAEQIFDDEDTPCQ